MPSALLCAVLLLSGAEPQQNTADPPDQRLERIRRALDAQTLQIQSLAPEPTFRVSIQQTPAFDESWRRDDLNGGPKPLGGLYAFEQRQRLGNPWVGQPLIQIDVLPIAERIIKSVQDARHARDERAANQEVLRALSAFCIANVCDATER